MDIEELDIPIWNINERIKLAYKEMERYVK